MSPLVWNGGRYERINREQRVTIRFTASEIEELRAAHPDALKLSRLVRNLALEQARTLLQEKVRQATAADSQPNTSRKLADTRRPKSDGDRRGRS